MHCFTHSSELYFCIIIFVLYWRKLKLRGVQWLAQRLRDSHGRCRIQVQLIRTQNPCFYHTLTVPCHGTWKLVASPFCCSPLPALRLEPAPHAAIFLRLLWSASISWAYFPFLWELMSSLSLVLQILPNPPNLAKCKLPASWALFFFIDSEDILVSSFWFKDFTVITMKT